MATVSLPGGAPRRWDVRFLDAVEQLGNKLPDPVAIFVLMIGLLVAVSVSGAAVGWSSIHPVTGETLAVKSLLSQDLVRQFLSEMPRTYTGFAPLGLVLVLILGAGVAEQSGLFSALLRSAMGGMPDRLLSPAVILMGMLATHASDASFLIFIPLAGLLFANAGRNPLLGIVLGFAGCCTGLAGNLIPGQYDVLIFGITEAGAQVLLPNWTMNPLGNWWFQLAIAAANVGFGWIVAVKVVGPRLPAWEFQTGLQPTGGGLTREEKRGLAAAGLTATGIGAVVMALMVFPAYAPLYDHTAQAGQPMRPFFGSIAGILFLLFLSTGWAYGKAAGTIRSHRDVVGMMASGLGPMLPYLVLVFFAAHFVAMFGWSNLGPITAIAGAAQLRELGAPPWLMLPILTTASAWLDFLIASGSAKWTAMAPVVVPMLMLLDISPEMTTAAYRVGDTVTNLISPLNPYFALTLIYCRRWAPTINLGTLLSLTLPFAIAFYGAGMLLTAGWVAFDLPLGPGAQVQYSLPSQPLP
ncbi:AbgT family transporter [Tsuneonella sp. HG249]